MKAKAGDADALVFNPISDAGLSEFLEQAHQLALPQARFVAWSAPEAAGFFGRSGQYAKNLIFVGNPVAKQSSLDYQKAEKEFMKKHPEGASFPIVIRTSFDAMKAMVAGIEAVGPDAKKVSEFLPSYTSEGAFGKLAFDENGDLVDIAFAIKEVREDGELRVRDDVH